MDADSRPAFAGLGRAASRRDRPGGEVVRIERTLGEIGSWAPA